MWKHYGVGIITSMLIGVGAALIMTSGSWVWEEVFFSVLILSPSGLIGGFISHMIDKKKSSSSPKVFKTPWWVFILSLLTVGCFLLWYFYPKIF